MLEKETLNDKIEIVQTGNGYPVIQVRTATIIKEDGEVISKNFHRHVLNPDADIAQEDLDVYAIAQRVFTAQVKADYQAYVDSLTPTIVADEVI
jgi:hypothetical protein